jgi:hypothetical protein
MDWSEWFTALCARWPIPPLPPPADPSPEFWDFRARWDAALAVAEWAQRAGQ